MQLPWEQVPTGANVRRVVPSAHVAWGGFVQLTPRHGSAAHTLPAQPKAHVVEAPDWHAPFEHPPAAVATPLEQPEDAHAVVVGA